MYNRFPCYGAMICLGGKKITGKRNRSKKPMRDFLNPVSALLNFIISSIFQKLINSHKKLIRL